MVMGPRRIELGELKTPFLLPCLVAPAGMSEPTGVRFPSGRKCHEH